VAGARLESDFKGGDDLRALVAGASGYLGSKLVAALADRGAEVVALVRDPGRAAVAFGDYPVVSVVRGDLLEPRSFDHALEDVDIAFYLVHSMSSKGNFASKDRRAAKQFADAARRTGVPRIIYLGGLIPYVNESELSAHLASRREVGQLLRGSTAVVQELRASIVLGSGSASFEMVRALVERLPVMVTPKWVSNNAQPIATDDLISCLIAASEIESENSEIYEVSGPDVVTYGDIMREYARQRRLRRLMIPVPVLTPWLSSLWLSLITPLYANIGRHLLESIRNPTVVSNNATTAVFGVHPVGVPEAIARAIGRTDDWPTSNLLDRRQVRSNLGPELLFERVATIGGERGWYFADWLWWLRGALDKAIGGPGLRRGRPEGSRLAVGDRVDFWRVDELEPGKKISLRSEFRLPGPAWLEFEVRPEDDGSVLFQTAKFHPSGFLGRAYWYLLWPVHAIVFRGMSRAIAAGTAGNGG
jgi:uncharacterized protein YbjT (DUF2867 family)